MSASIWNPEDTVPATGSIKVERFVASGGQTLFTLTEFTYGLGVNALQVYRNGVMQCWPEDFTETATNQFTLTDACEAGDIVYAVGQTDIVSGADQAAAAAASAAAASSSAANAAQSVIDAAAQVTLAAAQVVLATAQANAAASSAGTAASEASDAAASALAAANSALAAATSAAKIPDPTLADALKVLRVNGTGTAYELIVAGGGDVTGPASSTNNGFVKFDGTTGKLVKDSAATISIATEVSGLGTGIAAALAINTGSAGAPVLLNGAYGTPTSLTLTNASGLPLTGTTGTLAVDRGGTGQTTYTDGQLLIGNTTGNTLTKATLTAGTGISITNGAGSITIAATGGYSGTSVPGDYGTYVSYGGVGSYAFVRNDSGGTLNGGNTTAGSNLQSGAFSGTWMTMDAVVNNTADGLFVRIS